MTDLSDLIVFGFGYLAILACFLIMAINVFLAVLEYYVFAALAGIFLPFGLLAPTKFLAEKAIGAVVSASVKLMVLGLVTAIIDPVLSSIHFAGPEITFNELWSVFLTVCALMFLCWKAPNLAASLLGGSPHLGTGDLLQAAGTPIAAGMALGAVGGRALAGVSAMRAATTLGPTVTSARSAGRGGRLETRRRSRTAKPLMKRRGRGERGRPPGRRLRPPARRLARPECLGQDGEVAAVVGRRRRPCRFAGVCPLPTAPAAS
jgi:type IV secretion system protein TrbL